MIAAAELAETLDGVGVFDIVGLLVGAVAPVSLELVEDGVRELLGVLVTATVGWFSCGGGDVVMCGGGGVEEVVGCVEDVVGA